MIRDVDIPGAQVHIIQEAESYSRSRSPRRSYSSQSRRGSRSASVSRSMFFSAARSVYSHWPIFPQIFINGEFIGGSDIILNMHQSGELKEKLKTIAPNKGKAE